MLSRGEAVDRHDGERRPVRRSHQRQRGNGSQAQGIGIVGLPSTSTGSADSSFALMILTGLLALGAIARPKLLKAIRDR